MELTRRLDIQTKIILVLIAVIIPTFLVVTVAENKLALPMLEGEMRQIGISAADSLSAKILSNKWLKTPNGYIAIENEITDLIYVQPSIMRMDVFYRDGNADVQKLVASNVIEDEASELSSPIVESVTYEFKYMENGIGYWDVRVPIKQGTPSLRNPRERVVGMVHLLISTKTVTRLLETFWRITVVAAIFSVVILVLVLSVFLRKAIANEKLLIVTESQNLRLSEQLHETERQLMNTEKLAVMGQLTANLAHEIGTPLNAIGGHLQLLGEDLTEKMPAVEKTPRWKERLDIITGELRRIEQIVKNFLQTTSKPASQNQLVDLNQLVDKTIAIVKPRLDAVKAQVSMQLDRALGPIRVVPTDIEQILLNLLNNSTDSLREKGAHDPNGVLRIEVATGIERGHGSEYVCLSVFDTGLGISKEDLAKVARPFYTTKRPGEGTGLGLTISREIANRYGGEILIESKKGEWAKVTLRIPYSGRAT